MIEYENALHMMQQARDRCDDTIGEIRAEALKQNLGLDAAIYAQIEAGQHEATRQQDGLNAWEATAMAHSRGRTDLTPYFREQSALRNKIGQTVQSVQQRTLLGLMRPFEETHDAEQIMMATGMPYDPSVQIKQAYDHLRKNGTMLTIEANGKPLIKSTPARVLLPRQATGYISQQFYDEHLSMTDINVYKEVLTNAVQDILLTGLFPKFFREEVAAKDELLEEMIHNPLVSQAMPKVYAMAKEIAEAVHDKPSIWQKLRNIWH